MIAGFKALSRMSSSPTFWFNPAKRKPVVFQSAVAHELFSDARCTATAAAATPSFKALSRMSSSPTYRSLSPSQSFYGRSFKALSRMSSSPTMQAAVAKGVIMEFQSAVAHELFSDTLRKAHTHLRLEQVSKRCRA